IVNQARMLAYLLERMACSASRMAPFYGLHATDVDDDVGGASEHPVTVTLRRMNGLEQTGETAIIRAKFVVGCDGARSSVREAIGRGLVGDATDESWGVMAVLAVTDFPDVRLKSAISSEKGNILIIPREGGYLVRFYVGLDDVDAEEVLDKRSVTPEKLVEVA